MEGLGEDAVAAGDLVPADLDEGEYHIDRVTEDPDIGIAGIALDDNRQDSDFVIAQGSEEKDLGVEGETIDGRAAEKVEGRGPTEEFEAALRVGKFEVAEGDDLEQMKDACHEDAVPGGRLFELRSGEEARGDSDIGVREGREEYLELLYRDGQVGIDEHDRVEAAFEDASSDGGALTAILSEGEYLERDIHPLFFEFCYNIRSAIRTAVGHDDDLEASEAGFEEFRNSEDISPDDFGFLVARDDDGDFWVHNRIPGAVFDSLTSIPAFEELKKGRNTGLQGVFERGILEKSLILTL